MKILCLLPLFYPTKELLKRNIDSLKAFGLYIQNEKDVEFEVVMGGWGNQEFTTRIVDVLKNYFKHPLLFYFFKSNIGKASVVNTLYSNVVKKFNIDTFDYIFTMDSDIVFPKSGDLFKRLRTAFDVAYSKTQLSPGLISLGYTGNDPNWLNKFENRHQYKFDIYDEVISWPSRPSGIGGGALLINTSIWKKIGGYRTLGVYAPDDAFLLIDIFNNGGFVAVLESAKIHHPDSPPNEEYQAWKAKYLPQHLNNINTYEKSFKIAEDFWNVQMMKEEELQHHD